MNLKNIKINLKNISDSVLLGGLTFVTLSTPIYASSKEVVDTLPVEEQSSNVDIISQNITHNMRDVLKKSGLKDKQEAQEEATIIDYYESYQKFLDKNSTRFSIGTNQELLTFLNEEEFKNCIERMIFNVQFFDQKLSNEDLTLLRQQMILDYKTVQNYIEKNKNEDYNKLYYTILNYRLQESLKKNEMNDFTFDGIEFMQDEKIKYVAINMHMDGEPIQIYGNGYLLDIFENMQNGEKEKYVSDMKKLLHKRFDVDFKRNSINDFSVEVEKNKFASFLIAVGISAVASFITYKKSKMEEKKYTK